MQDFLLEEEEFDDDIQALIDSLEIESTGDVSAAPDVMAPKSRLEARKWVSAFLKLKKEQDWLKDEYIPHLTKKYIEPQKNKMSKMDAEKDALLSGLKFFLEQNEEGEKIKKVNFPDLGTVYLKENQAKVLYPENEDDFVQKLIDAGNIDYLVVSHKIDKKKIGQEFKDTNILPVDGLSIVDKEVVAQIRKVAEKNE